MKKLSDYKLGDVISNLCRDFMVLSTLTNPETIILFCKEDDKVYVFKYVAFQRGLYVSGTTSDFYAEKE